MRELGVEAATALRRVASSASREEFVCDKSRLFLDWTSAGAVMCTVSGPGLEVLADAIVERWQKTAAFCDAMQLLLDLGDMPVYDTPFRKVLTQWAADNRARLSTIDLLSRSKLVTMGAGVANLVLGGMVTVHHREDPFDARVRAAGLTPLTR